MECISDLKLLAYLQLKSFKCWQLLLLFLISFNFLFHFFAFLLNYYLNQHLHQDLKFFTIHVVSVDCYFYKLNLDFSYCSFSSRFNQGLDPHFPLFLNPLNHVSHFFLGIFSYLKQPTSPFYPFIYLLDIVHTIFCVQLSSCSLICLLNQR